MVLTVCLIALPTQAGDITAVRTPQTNKGRIVEGGISPRGSPQDKNFFMSPSYLAKIAQSDCLRIQAYYEKIKEVIHSYTKMETRSNSDFFTKQADIKDLEAAQAETERVMEEKECLKTGTTVYVTEEKGVPSFSDTPSPDSGKR